MNNKTVNKLFAISVFILLLPLIVIELIIKQPKNFLERVKLNFQLMLFVIDLGNQKHKTP